MKIVKPNVSKRTTKAQSQTVIACNRCKSRKQKCDGNHETGTTCSNCEKSSSECIYNLNRGPLYVKSLENKIEELEKALLSMNHVRSTQSPKSGVHKVIERMFLLPMNQLKGGHSSNKLDVLLNNNDLIEENFSMYIEFVHYKYPFLTLEHIRFLTSDFRVTPRDNFMYLMICAIGSKIVFDQKKSSLKDHIVFYSSAISILETDAGFSFDNLGDIQCVLLLVIYYLRAPIGTAIWDLIRFAMSRCVSLDLQKRGSERDQLTSCIFWTTYSLERVISNSFDKPYSISDKDISVELPLDNTMAVHLFKLRKIDSEIQRMIYRVDSNHENIPFDLIHQLRVKMKTWINTLPTGLSVFESDYCLYLFNKQICSLTRPFLTKLEPSNQLFTATIKSCIDLCQLSRRIHQSSSYRHSFISIQTTFESGATLVYGLLSRKVTWGFEVSESLRNCSSVLDLFSERSADCIKYRDAFEALVAQVKHLASSSSVPVAKLESVDLFGHNDLKVKTDNSHIVQNRNLFERLTNSNSFATDDQLPEDIFALQNLDALFENFWNIDGYRDSIIE